MFGRNPWKRLVTLGVVVAVSLAASAQPVLAFDGRSPDTAEVAQKAHAVAALDLRSPDTRDAAQQGHPGAAVDLRSPDTRDAAQQGHPGAAVDLRSPDTRDAVAGRSNIVQPGPYHLTLAGHEGATGVTSPAPIVVAARDGFSWNDFAIGAGAVLGSMLLLAGLAATMWAAQRRGGRKPGAART
jgi:hypothetical protein